MKSRQHRESVDVVFRSHLGRKKSIEPDKSDGQINACLTHEAY